MTPEERIKDLEAQVAHWKLQFEVADRENDRLREAHGEHLNHEMQKYHRLRAKLKEHGHDIPEGWERE